MVCTFFGHREITDNIYAVLKTKIKELIQNNGVDMFYVGNNGKFDRLALECLIELKNEFPNIDYTVVYAYLPQKQDIFLRNCNTIFPEELENVFPKRAIKERNLWMIRKTDFVITYVCHPWGGAAEFKEISFKRGKKVIELSEYIKEITLQ